MSRRLTLAAGIALAVLALAPVPAAAQTQGGQGLNLGQMLQMAEQDRKGPVDLYLYGRQAAAELAATAPLLAADHPLTVYVRQVVHTLALGSNAPYPYHGPVVGILDAPQTINAHAMPGGIILLTTGLLNFLRDEDELAALMGHELGHIELEHTLFEFRNAAGKAMWDKATNGSMQNDFKRLMPAIKQGYSIEIEAEADARAMQLAAVAGYDPAALVRVLERFKAKTNSYGGALYPLKRGEIAQKVAQALPTPSADAVAVRAARFQQVLAAAATPPAPEPASAKKGKASKK